jgi:hypothetical protein
VILGYLTYISILNYWKQQSLCGEVSFNTSIRRLRPHLYSRIILPRQLHYLASLMDSDDYPNLANLTSKSGITTMSFNVFKVGYVSAPVRDHYVLFVETDDNQKGYFIHACGDVQEGR